MNIVELLHEAKMKTAFGSRAVRSLIDFPDEINFDELKLAMNNFEGHESEKNEILDLFRDKGTVSKKEIIDVIKRISGREFEIVSHDNGDYHKYSMSGEPETFLMKIKYGTLKAMVERKNIFNESEQTWKAMKKILRSPSLHFDESMEIAFARIDKNQMIDGNRVWIIEEIQSDIETKLNESVGKLKNSIKILNDKVVKLNNQILKDDYVSNLVIQDLNAAVIANHENMYDIILKLKNNTQGNRLKAENAQFVITKLRERLNEEKNNLNFFLSVMRSWYIYLIILIINKAREEGVEYIGMIQDTPAGLSKNSSIYKKLYVSLPNKLGFRKVASPYTQQMEMMKWEDIKGEVYNEFKQNFEFEPDHFGFVDPFREEGHGEFGGQFARITDWNEYLEGGKQGEFDKWYTFDEAVHLAWQEKAEAEEKEGFERKMKNLVHEDEIWCRKIDMQMLKVLAGMKK